MEKDNDSQEIKINRKEKSGLAEFTERPLPTEEEVKKFEEIISAADSDADEEPFDSFSKIKAGKDEEIEDGLSEIYQDDNGDVVNVKKLDIKKKHGFVYWFFNGLFFLLLLSFIGYGFYYYIYKGGSDATAIGFDIKGEDKVMAGEEFFYTIDYKNLTSIGINNIAIELNYPDNFIFLDSSPLAQTKNNIWHLNNLDAYDSGNIKIKGKIVDKAGASGLIAGKITYMPDNFSSEFEKEASFSTEVKDIGVNLDFSYPSTVLVGNINEIEIYLSRQESNYFENFIMKIEEPENIEIVEAALSENNPKGSKLEIDKIKDNVWRIGGYGNEEEEILVKYKIKEKKSDNENIILVFKQDNEEEEEFIFFEKDINVEIMKSDLNLTLIVNGSKNDQTMNFGDKLNYSIVYANKGETSMKDVVVMAVLESDFLDWTTLKDESKGREKGNTLSWSKEEIPAFEELGVNKEGTIDFSINIMNFREMDLGKNFQVKSYAQFSIGDVDQPVGEETDNDNRSNVVINRINSDLTLKEEVRYFSEDNIPVGTGPLPPKVGEATSFKVYWVLTNNLHELREVQVAVSLPDYVSWDDKNRTSVGNVLYDKESHEVIWQIGRLPVTAYRADAEFNISITPTEDDKNKIMVLLPEAKIKAVDNETGDNISKNTEAKTTKLDDDEIANINSDGRVE